MLKQKLKNQPYSRPFAYVIIAALLLSSVGVYTGFVKADQFDDQIRALQNQNADSRAASNQLGAQASSYQDAISKLQSQIDSLQQAINTNQQQSTDLQTQINQQQAQLDQQKQVLGENIKAMYLAGQISTLEILASSNDLSSFVDRETARNAVQAKVKDSVDKITALKQELQDKQVRLQTLIKSQQDQQSQLGATQAQQNNLLAFTEGQKATYDTQIKNNNSQISALRAQQAAANKKLGGTAEAGDPNHGGYPAVWDQAYQDSLIDSWGMYNRECVSYTAWKVYQTYGAGVMPNWGGVGNANQWPGDARAAGIPTGSEPKANSVAISLAGFYGHAMWVEYVLPNGYIHVSQYNYDLAGHYSEMTINGAGLTYIYFGN